MVRQRAPYWMYSLEELRCDLTAFGEAVELEREGLAFARNVQYAILFDRLLRFPITGSRVRNYDGLGGQLLFAYLHAGGYLHWTDNRLTFEWDRVAEGVLGAARRGLRALPRRNRPHQAPALGGRARPGRARSCRPPPARSGSRACASSPRSRIRGRTATRCCPTSSRCRSSTPPLQGALAPRDRVGRGAGSRRTTRPPSIRGVLEAIAPQRRPRVRVRARPLHAAGGAARGGAFGRPERARSSCSTAPAPTSLAAGGAAAVGGGDLSAEPRTCRLDEVGAPEAVAGVKLLIGPGSTASSRPSAAMRRDRAAAATSTRSRRGCCRSRRSTELGTLYTLDEVRALAALAHARGLRAAHRRRALCRTRPPRSGSRFERWPRPGRRPALVRGYQERPARGRGRGGVRAQTCAGRAATSQAVAAAGLEDAVPRGPVRRAADRRSVAARRRARQRDGRRGSPMRWRTLRG